jgi:hypothetical protein
MIVLRNFGVRVPLFGRCMADVVIVADVLKLERNFSFVTS